MAVAELTIAVEPKLMTMEQYLRTSYSPDCDFVDGVVEERNLGEYWHAKLQTWIAIWLGGHAEEWNIDPLVEQRIRVSAKRVRICDVCVLRKDAPREDVTVTAPLLCIEVLSQEDRLSRAKKVLEDYRAMGVPHVLLIDPLHRCAYVFDADGLRLLESTARLELAGTPIYLPLDELFARLD